MTQYSEADDIKKALAGDIGARLRVEVNIPFNEVVLAFMDRMGELQKKSKDPGDEAKMKLFDDFADCVASQVYVFMMAVNGPNCSGAMKKVMGKLFLGKVDESFSMMIARLEPWMKP